MGTAYGICAEHGITDVDCTSLCGNRVLNPGEECDDGMACDNGYSCTSEDECVETYGSANCIARSFDGCSSACKFTNCTITNVSIVPSTGCVGNLCGAGDMLVVNVTYLGGQACNLSGFVQTDFFDANRSCLIQGILPHENSRSKLTRFSR